MIKLPTEEDVLSYRTMLSNAGRWGPDDELGTLNLITPDKRLASVALVRHGLTVSCAAQIEKNARPPDLAYPPVHFMIRSGESRSPLRPGAVEYFGLVFHGVTITHVDALGHSIDDGAVYGHRDAAVITGELGATELSVDAMRDGIVTRGVLLDVAGMTEREYLEPGEAVGPETLEATEQHEGVRIGSGDALLLRTGWWKRRHDLGPAPDRARPGLHAAALPWLRERGVAVVAADAANDVVPSGYPNLEQPIHDIGQVTMGLCLLDACDFDRLAEVCRRERRYEFLFIVAPLRIQYGTGSPVNPIAVL